MFAHRHTSTKENFFILLRRALTNHATACWLLLNRGSVFINPIRPRGPILPPPPAIYFFWITFEIIKVLTPNFVTFLKLYYLSDVKISLNYNDHVTVNADFVDNRYKLKNDFDFGASLQLKKSFFLKKRNLSNAIFYWLSKYQKVTALLS